ncbi:class A beta-lactamase [Salinisphaera sp. T31B1]|uniref:class A beta-lactamase n=1 Tax=Salinisphaera sp. T31B1 TaxID=727963 RepID=UPI00333E8154
MLSRRQFVLGLASTAPWLVVPVASAGIAHDDRLANQLEALERRHGGRLGVSILDLDSGRRLSHRGDERFLMCSTFKLLAASLVLARVDAGQERLSRRITYREADLVTYSPATEQHVSDGMTMAELCEAALTLSDNTAGNLMLESFGGPDALTAYLRGLGDRVTRLDRYEPELNAYAPGDERDTTTPDAMLANSQRLVLGNALSDDSRAQLQTWMKANRTGDRRLRAGLVSTWQVGDKTGSGDHNSANDVAVVWRDGRGPILVSAYYAGSRADNTARDRVLADVGRVASAF